MAVGYSCPVGLDPHSFAPINKSFTPTNKHGYAVVCQCQINTETSIYCSDTNLSMTADTLWGGCRAARLYLIWQPSLSNCQNHAIDFARSLIYYWPPLLNIIVSIHRFILNIVRRLYCEQKKLFLGMRLRLRLVTAVVTPPETVSSEQWAVSSVRSSCFRPS